jgi:hypothetical protein
MSSSNNIDVWQREGTRVIPLERTLSLYPGILTEGKVYKLEIHKQYGGIVVMSDNNREYWSEPEGAFKLAPANNNITDGGLVS